MSLLAYAVCSVLVVAAFLCGQGWGRRQEQVRMRKWLSARQRWEGKHIWIAYSERDKRRKKK